VDTVFVRALFDIDCDWEGLPPTYRVYVNDELFAERTWIWTDHYLTEMLQIQAPPGRYRVRVEKAGPSLAEFRVYNQRIEHGAAAWVKKGSHIDIYDESARIPS
jgi:hypothetical protein